MTSATTLTPLDPWAWRAVLARAGLLEVHPDVQRAKAITWDSRNVDADTAFVALPGESTHGNRFLAAALERGAPFVLTNDAVPRAVRVNDAALALRSWARAWREQTRSTIVGVTGSAGKTTLKEFTAAALNAGKTPGNLNTLNALACHMLSVVGPGETHVLEMGIDRVGEMAQLVALVAPDFGVISSVGPAHLEFFGSVEKIAFEKGLILSGGVGMVADSASVHYPGVPSYGFSVGATHRGSQLERSEMSTSFTYMNQRIKVQNPSLKVAEAALGALVIAQHFGLGLAAAIQRLQAVAVPGGRMRIERGRLTLIDDAYNANPLSVRAALETISRFGGRKIVVLGDMRELGPTAAGLHKEIGGLAGGVAALVIGVGEFGPNLAQAAAQAGAKSLHFASAADATSSVLEILRPDDVVLVKGSLSVGMNVIAEAVRATL